MKQSQKERILDTAVKLAELRGYENLAREDVSEAAGVTPSLISYYFRSISRLKSELMEHAIRTRNYRIICQGLALHNPRACAIPRKLKIEAVKILTK